MKKQAYKDISDLVKRFEEQLPSYKNSNYNETATRRDFIDPFFKALGWDMDNKQGAAEAYREVIHEDRITVGDAKKAPDYSFRLPGGKRLFFVEAKKPSVFIKEEVPPAYQIKRYAWSAKLSISLLTDFEEFAVYDCRVKPKLTDKASLSRIKYLTFREYLAEFDFLWETFARENVLRGSFDKFVLSDKNKKGTETVDKEFLASLDEWRKLLAVDISKNNKKLDENSINYAVQQTIDRIIFLRICEDRGIEPSERLKGYIADKHCYQNLFEYFKEADKKYNSGLFDFKKDKLSQELDIDDKVLKEIIKGLYYPECPFEFSVLPVEILGSAYEQFLGKVIRLTAGHHAKVEEKPEVRKAGGVYYTPQYIVEYIVKNTVGKLVEGKTAEEVEKIKIIDPACGSGSFLLGAYQFLLDWHMRYYDALGKKERSVSLTPSGGLTTAMKKKILLNNIFGVDLDAQAVEVTKLSLLLKCMEGETEASVKNQLSMFHERVLPSLETNIKCGNSLIGTDFYADEALDLFEDDKQRRKINAFDWDGKDGFPEIMKAGGFDAVIGNPPYVFGRDWKALNIGEDVKSHIGNHYKVSPYQLDMFSIFMEKVNIICKHSGCIGQIVPNVWLNNTYSSSIRTFVLSNSTNLIIASPIERVFPSLTVDTIVYTYQKSPKHGSVFTVVSLNEIESKVISTSKTAEFIDGKTPISTKLSKNAFGLLTKIEKALPKLKEVTKITRGVHPYRTGGYGNSAYSTGSQIQRDVDERPYNSTTYKKGFRPFVYGKNLKRLSPIYINDYINYGHWLAEPRQSEFFQGERVYSRKILGDRIIATVILDNSVADQQVYITLPKKDKLSAFYIAGIISSRFVSYFIRQYYNEEGDAFPQIKVSQLQNLPFPISEDSLWESRHTIMVSLVKKMLELSTKIKSACSEQSKTLIQRQIDGIDNEIDKLVYELYGLTEEEIRIVEESK